MEILAPEIPHTPVRAVLFDFDGTISTLRCGWEKVMRPLMLEYIDRKNMDDAQAEKWVDGYIDESTGIQTIYQMQWLAEHSRPEAPKDPWWYKDEYNRRLMEQIDVRKKSLLTGAVSAEEYRISGAVDFLRALRERGVRLFVASGTDHPDVLEEAGVLGVRDLFDEIAGAPVRAIGCSKEKVMRNLMSERGLRGSEVAVIGDGKVEIALGRAAGARTIGLATNERARRGVDPVKRKRLIQAGADAIHGDFEEREAMLRFLGL